MAPAFLEPLMNAPRWQRALVGTTGLVILAVGAYLFLISPIETRIEGLTAEQASLQRELIESRRIVANIAQFRREIAELEKRIEIIKDKLPTEREMPRLYRTVSDAAFQSGLGVALFQPQGARVTEYYSEIPIVVNAEGGYHQFGEFFERLAVLPRIVNVVEWKFTGQPKGKNTLVKADMTLATYVYRPVGSPPVPGAAPQRGQPR